jgi:hypothetical protein
VGQMHQANGAGNSLTETWRVDILAPESVPSAWLLSAPRFGFSLDVGRSVSISSLLGMRRAQTGTEGIEERRLP